MTDTMDNRMDDGSLAFLQIPRDEKSRSFNCEATSQSKLVNTTFWVVDIIEDVETRWSKQKDGCAGRMLCRKGKNHLNQRYSNNPSVHGSDGQSTVTANTYYKPL